MANFLIYLIIFGWGACIGSFLNVVIYRLPAKISLINPPSRCPKCFHPLGKTENIPVIGWLWLRGECRWCHTPISPRYPLIEAMTGLFFALVFHQFGFTWLSVGYVIFLSWLIALALIDMDTMTLPNSLTQSGLIMGVIWQTWLGFTVGGINTASVYLFISILSAVIGIWLFDTIRFIGSFVLGKPAMGGGDPKLTAMIGSWLGWQGVLITGFLACVYGTIIGFGAIALKLLEKGKPMPFGPFLVLGAITAIFLGDFLLSSYLEYIGF
ncbi:leader peptidase (Prepilin peptidase) [Geminocystis sp. NIES-3708]|uniref:prepilin peptidase n=1 Tax=Geminocystis sp. NIES-3708 TaxID=1615909 RepID=UPI0005FCAD14|nr:A24 family peptidase [Geminocystis sp. NIES-3708]BAQ61352.1 leader peptidase (Prepilin peptidase) [Geminocystis sp. NIES-3708]